jgi:hypothetical protein
LALLQRVDIEQIRSAITEKEIEKDRLIRSSSEKTELEKTKLQNEKDATLREIQANAQVVTEQIRELNEKKMKEYGKLEAESDKWQIAYTEIITLFSVALDQIDSFPIEEVAKTAVKNIVSGQKSKQILALGKEPAVPVEPAIIPIELGVPKIPSKYDPEYVVFVESRISLLDKYKEVKAKEIEIPVIQVENTDTIDSKLTELKIRRDSADKNNQLVARYGYWNTWIEAKGLYEKEIDILRKLYGKVNTGVSGLIISPEITNSGRVEIWLKYDGKYDPDFFGNTTGDHRYLFEYSAFQRSIIGLLLQASRLDMKDKVLRMAFVDDISVTKKSIEMIERVCGEFDLKLWTSYATDDYDLDNIPDGEIIVESGCIFFNK